VALCPTKFTQLLVMKIQWSAVSSISFISPRCEIFLLSLCLPDTLLWCVYCTLWYSVF